MTLVYHFAFAGLFNFTPYQAHFCTHTSAIILRKLLAKNKNRQLQSKRLFEKLEKWQRIEINDWVRVRNLKKLIQKESSVFYRATTEEVYRVSQIDKSEWPYLIKLKDYPAKDRRLRDQIAPTLRRRNSWRRNSWQRNQWRNRINGDVSMAMYLWRWNKWRPLYKL